MLAIGWWRPREKAWTFSPNAQVDMTPWRFAKPLAITLFSCVVALYIVFSPIGFASAVGLTQAAFLGLSALVVGNLAIWLWAANRVRTS